MWIKFIKEAAANERVYHVGDTSLFQEELGQKLVDDGFAEYFDPKFTQPAPKAEPKKPVKK